MKNALSISPASVPAPKKLKRPSDDTGNRGELDSINVEMTENGCIVRCSFEPKDIDPKQDRFSQMPEDEKYSFDDVDKAGAYVIGMMKGQMDYEAKENGGKEKASKGAGKKPTAKAAGAKGGTNPNGEAA